MFKKYAFLFCFSFCLSLASAFDFPHTIVNIDYEGNLTNLSEMQDVNIPAPSNDYVLTYDSGTGKWISSASQGGTDTNASTACSGTDYLAGNGSCLSAVGGGSGDITAVTTNGNYLTGGANSGDVDLLFNETVLNATIDSRGGGDTWWGLITGYIFNNSNSLDFNETKLNSTIDSRDSDTTYTNGTGLSLTGTVFSLIGSFFSGSWNDLTDVPSGFADGIDNDTAGDLTHLTNFTDDLGDRGYTSNLNFTNEAGYYNSSNFSISDYFTSSEVLAFNYYNSTDFDINDYLNLTTLLGFNYYNSSNFSISDYYTKTDIDGFNYWNDTFATFNKTYADTLYADISMSGDNSSWNKTYADTLYVDIDGDTMTGNLDSSANMTAVWLKGKYNWTVGDTWNVFDGTTLTFNESKLASTYYDATTSVLVAGTIDAGTLDNIRHNDGNYDGITINVSEASGSPGLDLRINFTGVDSFDRAVMRYKAPSISGDAPVRQLWNYDTFSWDILTTVTESTNFAIVTQSIFNNAQYIQDNIIQLRIYKAGNGNTQNHYYIDWVAMIGGYGVPSGEEVDPKSYHTDADINATGYNVTANYYFGNGSQLTGITMSESDPYWSANQSSYSTTAEIIALGYYNDISNFTGTLTNDKICIYDSAQGIINCTYTDQTGAGGNVKSGDGTYTYNDTDTIYFNSTYAGTNLEVNGSDYWDNYGTANSTWFENIGGVLSLRLSELTSWANTWLSGKDTDDLSEGLINLYDNSSWNKTYADTLYADISVTGDNSSWNESHANTLYRTDSWNNLTGIPHATPSNGNVAHFSLADEIYDFVIGLGYATTTYADNLVGTYSHLTNFTDDLGDRGYTSNSNFTNDEGYTTNTGTITSIETTAPISGGTITTTGTISITNDGIGDTQLEYNTGQHLTTTSNPTLNNVTVTNCIVFGNGATMCGV